MASAQLRPVLARLPAYLAGGLPGTPPAGLAPYKLSSNENPYPPLTGIREAAAAAAAQLNRYPPPTAVRLERALAARLGLEPAQVVVGAGSVGLLQQIVAAAAGTGDEAVFAWRSFEAYPIVIAVGGATAVPVPLTDDGRHDLAAMAAAVTGRTRLVLLCTPNNPTGPALGAVEVQRFLDAIPGDVLVVIDEAYVEFVTDPTAVAGLAVALSRPNVLVLRTFSKAYGLAGMRVGYAAGPPAVVAALRQVTVPFTVSAVSEAAGLAALAAEPELIEQVRLIVAERERVVPRLRAAGWDVPEAQGNFYWLATGDRTAEFVAACEQVAVSVRPLGGAGVRVTVGEPEANERVLRVAQEFLRRPSGC